ncbi:MAG TPA: hypothetical protein EYP19_13235 [Desulfobacterales bacterium]|nr:hypothetical protein [Desulfobacterales bacterium]
MSIHIVIDGYNLIRQSPALSIIEHRSLEEGREALLKCLAAYKRVKHHQVTVVFDGAYADMHMDRRTRCTGINVVFSRPGQLADSVIKGLVARDQERAIVVTSDRDIAGFAAKHGAVTIDSIEFEDKMKMATDAETEVMDFSEEEVGWTPTTKKKGPTHRVSKRQRKRRVRTRKL